MNIKSLITLSIIGVFALAGEGEKLFDQKCSSCHIKTRPTNPSKLIAPPIMGVMKHVKEKYNDKKSAVEFISDYVINPSKEKALCLPQKIKKFGLMPSQKGNVTKEELEKIASYLYDHFPPKGFKGMMHKNF